VPSNQNDLLARILAVALSGLAALWASFATQDRFTGSQGSVLEERLNAVQRDIDRLPPEWLRRDIMRVSDKVDELEHRVEALEHHDHP